MKMIHSTQIKMNWSYCLTFLLASAMLMLPDMASAADVIGGVLCDVVEWFNGPVGKGIATLAIIIIGVGALMGKVSWGMAIIVGIGVAVVFGADDIVNALGGDGGSCGGGGGIGSGTGTSGGVDIGR